MPSANSLAAARSRSPELELLEDEDDVLEEELELLELELLELEEPLL